MAKTSIEPGNYIYPMPLALIGAQMPDGKPNFMVVAYVGAVNHQPPVIMVSMAKDHATNEAIEASGAFTVNIPSSSMIDVVDYTGTVSGKEMDKSSLYKVFYGELGNAPMIQSAPINLECKLADRIEYPYNVAYIGDVVGSYVEESLLAEGLPDMGKVDPLCFSMHDFNYYRLGDHMAKVWSLGPSYTPDPAGF